MPVVASPDPSHARPQAEQAAGSSEPVVMRQKSRPPQPTLNSIPDEDGFEEDELPGEFGNCYRKRAKIVYVPVSAPVI